MKNETHLSSLLDAKIAEERQLERRLERCRGAIEALREAMGLEPNDSRNGVATSRPSEPTRATATTAPVQQMLPTAPKRRATRQHTEERIAAMIDVIREMGGEATTGEIVHVAFARVSPNQPTLKERNLSDLLQRRNEFVSAGHGVWRARNASPPEGR